MLQALLRALATVIAASAASGTAHAADWPTYHGDNLRTGVASSPKLGQLSRAWSKKVDGQVYAEPLIARGRVIVATENNSVYAFDTSGRQVWRRHLAAPVSGGSLPCGNIDPSGITGTPAIDTRSGTVYAVTFSGSFRHQLVAIALTSGRVRWRKSIDAPGSDSKVEQERGALVISHGRVYVPFGGLFGDCGDYHGLIVSRTLHGKGLRSYRNPATEAGMWAPGGLAADGKGNIFGTTGNGGGSPSHYQYSNAVLRLTPTLRRTAYWAPTDWQALSGSDTDVGSVQPTVLAGGDVFQSGKNRSRLPACAQARRHRRGGVQAGRLLGGIRRHRLPGAVRLPPVHRRPLRASGPGAAVLGRVEGERAERRASDRGRWRRVDHLARERQAAWLRRVDRPRGRERRPRERDLIPHSGGLGHPARGPRG